MSGCSHALLVRGAFPKVSVTSPSEPVSIGVRASWLGSVGGVRARGFVSRSFLCWGFLASFHLCGLPCLVHVPVLTPTWQFLCSVIRWSFVVRWGALTCGCLRWPVCWLPCNSLHAVMRPWTDTAHSLNCPYHHHHHRQFGSSRNAPCSWGFRPPVWHNRFAFICVRWCLCGNMSFMCSTKFEVGFLVA